jgi:hypothetical protein
LRESYIAFDLDWLLCLKEPQSPVFETSLEECDERRGSFEVVEL